MSTVTQFRGVDPWLQTYWDWRAVGNFSGGGTGAGFLAAAAIAAMSGAPARWLAFVGLAFVGAGLTCVWMEIGRPFRALNVFFNPKTSWMTREAMVAPVLFGVGGLAFLLDSGLALVGAALVGMVFLYCQARILHASKGIPAWRLDETVPLIATSGLTEGMGLFLVAAPLLLGASPTWAMASMLLFVVARFAAFRAYMGKVSGGAVPKASAKALSKVLPAVLYGGHVVPAVLLVLALATGQGFIAALAGLAAAGAGWWLKFTMIVDAGYTQGYAIERSPARTPGYSGTGAKPGW